MAFAVNGHFSWISFVLFVPNASKMILNSKVIAVDFDGTIVFDQFPKIGKERPFAFETLRILVKEGHRLVLWTVREGKRLEEALEFCKKNGVEFYAINASFPEEDRAHCSRKITVDIFIDDRNVGGFPGWGEVYQMIMNHPLPERKRKFPRFFK